MGASLEVIKRGTDTRRDARWKCHGLLLSCNPFSRAGDGRDCHARVCWQWLNILLGPCFIFASAFPDSADGSLGRDQYRAWHRCRLCALPALAGRRAHSLFSGGILKLEFDTMVTMIRLSATGISRC